jgi:hypothetical protein
VLECHAVGTCAARACARGALARRAVGAPCSPTAARMREHGRRSRCGATVAVALASATAQCTLWPQRPLARFARQVCRSCPFRPRRTAPFPWRSRELLHSRDGPGALPISRGGRGLISAGEVGICCFAPPVCKVNLRCKGNLADLIDALWGSGDAPVAQRIEHLTTDQKVGGSNPSGRTNFPVASGYPPATGAFAFAGSCVRRICVRELERSRFCRRDRRPKRGWGIPG